MILPFNGLQFALTVVMPIMPIVVMAQVSLRILIFNHSVDRYSDLAMKMVGGSDVFGVLKTGS